MDTYYVTLRVNARFITKVKAENLEEATGLAILNKMMEEENESINQHLQLLLPRQRRSP